MKARRKRMAKLCFHIGRLIENSKMIITCLWKSILIQGPSFYISSLRVGAFMLKIQSCHRLQAKAYGFWPKLQTHRLGILAKGKRNAVVLKKIFE